MQSSSSTVELPRRVTRRQKRLAEQDVACLEADTRSTARKQVMFAPIHVCLLESCILRRQRIDRHASNFFVLPMRN